jgi:hypothetical protein
MEKRCYTKASHHRKATSLDWCKMQIGKAIASTSSRIDPMTNSNGKRFKCVAVERT